MTSWESNQNTAERMGSKHRAKSVSWFEVHLPLEEINCRNRYLESITCNYNKMTNISYCESVKPKSKSIKKNNFKKQMSMKLNTPNKTSKTNQHILFFSFFGANKNPFSKIPSRTTPSTQCLPKNLPYPQANLSKSQYIYIKCLQNHLPGPPKTIKNYFPPLCCSPHRHSSSPIPSAPPSPAARAAAPLPPPWPRRRAAAAAAAAADERQRNGRRPAGERDEVILERLWGFWFGFVLGKIRYFLPEISECFSIGFFEGFHWGYLFSRICLKF